jgi:archaeoflavoprotein AfpA
VRKNNKIFIRILWGITGAGDLLPEVFQIMEEMAKTGHLEITVVLSKAAVKVVRSYKLSKKLENIFSKVLREKDSNTPFLGGAIQTGTFNCLVIAPATANTVAKLVNGIADTLLTNAVAQAGKTGVKTYILPVDRRTGIITTILPKGERLRLRMREVDVQNTAKLKKMEGIVVLDSPTEIRSVIRRHTG